MYKTGWSLEWAKVLISYLPVRRPVFRPWTFSISYARFLLPVLVDRSVSLFNKLLSSTFHFTFLKPEFLIILSDERHSKLSERRVPY